jgi:RNA polymerase sigma-70 factor (ECF subfamily)
LTIERARRVDDCEPAYATARARTAAPHVRIGLEDALERLPPGARQVFVLYDIEGYTHPEIGSLLGVTVGTSKTQLHRARMMLRDVLGRNRET